MSSNKLFDKSSALFDDNMKSDNKKNWKDLRDIVKALQIPIKLSWINSRATVNKRKKLI